MENDKAVEQPPDQPPALTGTAHTLPFDRLSPRDFERLCLWLVEREGYQRAEHLGAAGSEQGRDLIAWRSGELWAFQCKRVQNFYPKQALAEVEKVLALPADRRPMGLVFFVTCDVAANVRQQARDRCAGEGLGCHFWTGTELDEKVKQHPDVLAEFFEAGKPSQVEDLRSYISRAVAVYEARMLRLVTQPPPPLEQPYKGLYAFDIQDAGIFFGRETAGEALHHTILQDRLTVLHARSGAGKTSLLNAGLSPRLIREGCLPVYARAYDDPVRAIKRAIAPPSLGPWPASLQALSLHEFLGLVCDCLSRDTQELVIFLDQFEEFFVFWPERDHRQPVVDSMGDCYEDQGLRQVRFVIGIRTDYFGYLATFQSRLPHIFHNEYYLEAMTCKEAKAAITGPVAKLDRELAYEPALLDMLLDDLAQSGSALLVPRGIEGRPTGGVELPHLQIVCTRLYEALAQAETIITLAAYEALGGAKGVLGRYLQDVLDRLPGRGVEVARAVLAELVSSEATKRVLSYEALAAKVEVEASELGNGLDDVLARLVNGRLLRRDEVAGEVVYEMAHEYLIGEIEKWIDAGDLGFKQAEELLAREVTNWRVHGTLVPRDRLELLFPYRERFRGLEEESWQCVVQSALRARFAVVDWVKLAGNPVVELVFQATADDDAEISELALEALVALGEVAREAVAEALRGTDQRRWLGALGYLRARPDDPLWTRLPASIWDEFLEVADRRLVVEAWVRLGSEDVVAPLFRAAGDAHAEVGKLAAQALVGLGEVSKLAVARALRSTDQQRWRGALRYLGMRPDDPLWAEVPNEMLEEILGQPMVWVPPGPFLMGSDKDRDPQALDRELPRHMVTLPGYWIGRHSVTVARFKKFVGDSGHQPASADSLKGQDDHPVVNVTWHDALAFCRWLGEQSGLPVALPSEAQWEKAARGTDDRIHPWGDEPPDEKHCNFGNKVGKTTPVGQYSPSGDSPYGCVDMAGNVWEWCSSLYKPHPYEPGGGRENLDDKGYRGLRGGAFNSFRRSVRCAARYGGDPDHSGIDLGFRCCVAARQD